MVSVALDGDSQVGAVLATRLGLKINKREGHDLAGPCIACRSSDAFRMHQQTGVAQCYSCGGKWSPFQVAEAVLRDREQTKALMIELGLFKPAPNTSGKPPPPTPPDPIGVVAGQKAVTPESLRAFGAKAIGPYTVRLPAYGLDGRRCTYFDISVRGGKGKFAYGKKAGLFFPHEAGKVRLPQPGETWHLVEGPKDAAALHGLGLLACGLNTCRLAAKFARLSQGVQAILVPDRDVAGEKGAQHSAQVLREVASSVRVAALPVAFKESDGEDVRDVLRRPGGRELVLQAIVDAQPVQQASPSSPEDEDGDVSGEVAMPDGDPLTLTVSSCFGKPQRLVVAKRGDVSHRDRINTDSSISRDRFLKRLAQKLGMDVDALGPVVDPQITAPADQVDEQATGAGGNGGDDNVYLDLCKADWEVVEITPSGWQVIGESPVKFRRSSGMLPLPMPKAGGSVDGLHSFLNLDDSMWPLVIAWLVAALRPWGPYPVLALFAEQGNGKSTTGRLLRDLVDPNAAPLRAEPRDGRDLMIAANNSWCLAYDNLSHVPPRLSDAFCRLSTGGGFATRELYTDQEVVIFDATRPILLTSIEEVATRADLLERCVIVWLPAIHESSRRPEAKILKALEEARPRILGALLNAVAGALKHLPSTNVDSLPRMADFALWVAAAESVLGWPKGTFMAAYAGNRASAHDVALEASPVARPLLEMLDEQGEWAGTSSDLLEVLESRVPDQLKRLRVWPSNARSMSGHLKRLAPNLRAAGWQVEFHREHSRRLWSIQRQVGFASSDPFASHLRHTGVDADWCKTVQAGASSQAHDAHDASDANAGAVMAAPGRSGDGREEGDR